MSEGFDIFVTTGLTIYFFFFFKVFVIVLFCFGGFFLQIYL